MLELLREAHQITRGDGIPNLFQPGLIREMVLADRLGHILLPGKRDADATDSEGNLYEYLTALTGGEFQIDRLTSSNLYRITRNRLIYCATFCRTNLLDVVEVYAVEPDHLVEEARRQIAVSRNHLVHFTVRNWWVVEHGRRVVPEE